ncbi:class I SAM-dependent methyltransferase [Kineococcus indalonis]|uniref:class I SAM-dependent methyltransferase n=1 Tax=Kineococcus indalonis TaxID=2696566 RepID=UPI0014129691|nr:methyltransferase domain-containing protein [Kineococcus indalonis]
MEAVLGGFEALSVYLGDRLGWYRDLRAHGPTTPAELAARTGTRERYAREWLEQQAVAGLLRADPAPGGRRYALPPGAAEVLTDPDSLAHLAPLPRMLAAAAAHLPELLHAYRHGGGVSWERLGADARESQADLNRPWFLHALPGALAQVPRAREALARPGARVLDVGCGAGWSSIALALAHPGARVLGVDVDAASLHAARAHAADAGVADRVAFRLADAAALDEDGAFDLALAAECVHDLPDPVGVLGAVRRAVRPDGAVVVVDEAVAEEFTAPGDDVERLMYGFSLLVCLPDGLSAGPASAGTGTVMRRPVLEGYARAAGFAGVDALPVEGFSFLRFYLLRR